jgi:hypothetical protein
VELVVNLPIVQLALPSVNFYGIPSHFALYLINNSTMKFSVLKHILPVTLLLLFILFSCEKKSQQPATSSGSSSTSTTSGTTTGGTTTGGTTTGSSFYQNDSLTGTKWTLYQYRDALTTTPLPRTDTLVFIDADTYTWNGVPQQYWLGTQQNIYNKYVFDLKNTPFGSLRGFPPLTLKTYGEIINEPFTQSGQTNGQTFYMWFKKIN